MESSEQSSYHEDILKVKKIWGDLREVEKAKKRQQQLKTKQDKNKKIGKSQKQRERNMLHKAISQEDFKNMSQSSNEQVVSFSTISPHIGQQIKLNSNPTSYITSFKNRQKIQTNDSQLSLLRITNQQLKDQITDLKNIIKQKDELIDKLKLREHQLLGETLREKNERVFDHQLSVQYLNYKNDAARLLKMLQTTKQFKQFAQLAIQDDGVRFLHQANRHKKSIIDATQQKSVNVHFCSCNGQFLSQKNLWIPQKAYNFAKQFAKQKQGEQLSQPQLQLLLYELNRIWRERQKKILNSADSLKTLEIGKYKRRIQEIERSSGKRIFAVE